MDDNITQTEAAQQSEEQAPRPHTLHEAAIEQAVEEDTLLGDSPTLFKILGGDLLNTALLRQQVGLIVLITVIICIYVALRYSCQQSLIEIDTLQKELLDAKYRALSANSKLTEISRESNVLQILQANRDSTLHIADQPPYIIPVPAK